VRSAGRATLMEEIPEAYKDVSEVVDVVHGAGISKKGAQLRPLRVIKGKTRPSETPHPDIYEPLSHTGDLGMVAYGQDLPELFAHAAWAMFDLMSDAPTIRPQHTMTLSVSAVDLEDLLVRWLSELPH